MWHFNPHYHDDVEGNGSSFTPIRARTCARVHCARTHIPSNQFWQAGPLRNLGATWGQENLLQRPWVYFLLVGQWLPAGWSGTKSKLLGESVEYQVISKEGTVSWPKMGAKGIEQGGNNNNNEVGKLDSTGNIAKCAFSRLFSSAKYPKTAIH